MKRLALPALLVVMLAFSSCAKANIAERQTEHLFSELCRALNDRDLAAADACYDPEGPGRRAAERLHYACVNELDMSYSLVSVKLYQAGRDGVFARVSIKTRCAFGKDEYAARVTHYMYFLKRSEEGLRIYDGKVEAVSLAE